MSQTLQYIIVFFILVGVGIAVVIKLLRLRRKGKVSSCCGCALADSCNKPKKHDHCDGHN